MKTIKLGTNNLDLVEDLMKNDSWKYGWEIDGDSKMIYRTIRSSNSVYLFMMKKMWRIAGYLYHKKAGTRVWL